MVIASDEMVTRLVSGGLRVFKPGYRVVSAPTLHDASEWVGTEPPDLVIVDLAETPSGQATMG